MPCLVTWTITAQTHCYRSRLIAWPIFSIVVLGCLFLAEFDAFRFGSLATIMTCKTRKKIGLHMRRPTSNRDALKCRLRSEEDVTAQILRCRAFAFTSAKLWRLQSKTWAQASLCFLSCTSPLEVRVAILLAFFNLFLLSKASADNLLSFLCSPLNFASK